MKGKGDMGKFWSDFKAFAFKGNIIDMAVGVVIGGAFGKIVTSLVNDIVTPLISLATGKVMLSDIKWVINEAVLDEAGNVIQAESALTYGNFIQSIIDFFIIALSIFFVVRAVAKASAKLNEQKLAKEKAEKEAAEAEAKAAADAAAAAEAAADAHKKEVENTELALLREIRDLMKK